ncbi:hypothetical protein V491_04626 [Pseudogymnoascus sp. VKM F-3775]|nr:hypothetical protein V491_04626 [Pseudogymnoascus sp. VKM F-3775]
MSIIFKRGLATTAPKLTQSVNFAKSPKIVCIGRNYAAHAAELNNAQPKQPFFFLKPASSMLLPGAGPVQRPQGVDLHYEVELALLIGRNIKDLSPDDTKGALDSIEGYAVTFWSPVLYATSYHTSVLSARNMQDEAKAKGLPWSIAKGFDTFLPLSNTIPKSAIADPHAAEVWLSVNGEKKQDDSTGLMVFRIPRILSDISKVMKLRRGDIVLTGTPKGVGSVKPGDVMTAGISPCLHAYSPHYHQSAISDVQSDAVPAGRHDGVGSNEWLSASPNAGNVLAIAESLARHEVGVKLLKIAVKAADLGSRHEGVHLHGAVEAVPQVPLLTGNGDRRDSAAGGGDGSSAAKGREPDHDLVITGSITVAASARGGEDVIGDVGNDAGTSVSIPC